MASVNSTGYCPSPLTTPLYTVWFILYLLCFPVFLSVLFILYRKHKHSPPLSHSDVFTLHLVVAELVNLLATCFVSVAVYAMEQTAVVSFGMILSSTTRFSRVFFHDLTCVDRYLAVVHPVTYLRLKKGVGVSVRNTCVGLAWLLSTAPSSLMFNLSFAFHTQILMLMLMLASAALISFCTVSVLCVLIGPVPGEGGGERKGMNRSKRAALHTMMLVLGSQMLSIINSMAFYSVGILLFASVDLCLLRINSAWLELSDSLVLPLLFLLRAKRKR